MNRLTSTDMQQAALEPQCEGLGTAGEPTGCPHQPSSRIRACIDGQEPWQAGNWLDELEPCLVVAEVLGWTSSATTGTQRKALIDACQQAGADERRSLRLPPPNSYLAGNSVCQLLSHPNPWTRLVTLFRMAYLTPGSTTTEVEQASLWATLEIDLEARSAFDSLMSTRATQESSLLAHFGFRLPKSGTLVDIAGGSGHYARKLLDELGSGWSAIVTDSSQQAIDQRVRDRQIGYLRRDWRRDPLPDGHFFLLSSVLHNNNDGECLDLLNSCASSEHAQWLMVIERNNSEADWPSARRAFDMAALFDGCERSPDQLITLLNASDWRFHSLHYTSDGYVLLSARRRALK